MADRKEKGEHAARQLHVNSALFSTRIALQVDGGSAGEQEEKRDEKDEDR